MEPWVSQDVSAAAFSLALETPGPSHAPVPARQILSGPLNELITGN